MNPIIFVFLMIGALALASVAVAAAVFFFQRWSSPDPSVIHERLIQIKQRQAEDESLEANERLKKMSRLYKEADYQNEALGARLEQLDLFRLLKLRLQQAGMKTPADRYFMMNMAFPVVIFTVLGLISGIGPLMLLGPGVAFGSFAYVMYKRGQRYGRFIALMPDALGMITSALRAGHSFQSALGVVAVEMTEPVSTEFSSLVRDINLGIPVREALNRLVNKLDALPDVRMFATAVSIQREAGGNLAEVLEGLGYTIRERFKLKGQISALTAQSRLTGYVLGGAPAAILIFLSIFMPSYVKPLYNTDLGHFCLVVIVVLQSIGFFIMKKIIEIRV